MYSIFSCEKTLLNKTHARERISNFLTRFYIQPAITCSKLIRETLEQSVKYVQS